MLPNFGGFNSRRLLLLLTIFVSLVNSEILTPPYFNLAEKKKITATATCGVDTEGPELYCKLVGANAENDNDVNLIQGQYCDHCDPKRKDKMHPPEFAIDGRETWWQSPPLSRGMKYNEVNLTIDLGQEFHVAYVYIRMGNSPRPGLWILEKSADYGQSYTPWQYFSDSPADCERFFGRESLQSINRDDSVICSTEFSKIVPLEGGEIPISLLNNRPSSNHYFNSSVLQEWTRATNVRIRLLRTKNLLGHLMSVARQDPTVTRRYFYSIKDISIGGRCMCNGHADTCYSKNDTEILICQCRHNTCGDKCERCCPGYEQKAWKQSKSYHLFACEPCNCFLHSNECVYDPEVDKKRLSLDIHGKYEGGGVCLNCQHNTEGINCNKCKDKFYKPSNKHWNETDVCQPCNCNYYYSTGNCAQGSGQCECRKEYQPPYCDSCSFGHYGYPDCKECDCYLNGTHNYQCELTDGKCSCLSNFGGQTCRKCADGYYNFPQCQPCECDSVGSATSTCEQDTGNCVCKSNYGGKQCDRCKDGFYNYPTCEYCNCDIQGAAQDEICNKETGKCICKEGYSGEYCGKCGPGYYGYPECKPCNCSSIGSQATNCDINGKCPCLGNFGGRMCDLCSPGYYKYPECLPCECNQYGSIGITCEDDGRCECEHNFDGDRCEVCKEGFYNFPVCEGCNCHPAGVVAGFEGCGSVPAGELCKCKDRVQGRICNKCKPLYWNLNLHNPEGCEECRCNPAGALGGISVCNSDNGQCVCKPSVVARGCTECDDGTYNLQKDNLFGCTDCGCDIGGSVRPICDKISGQCLCQSRVTGRTCKEAISAHYFPTLFQYQYEIENGRTLENTPVKYNYNETIFANYSWKGYAEFTNFPAEVLQEIIIQKPSLYRMVLRYVNKNQENVIGTIKVIPDNPTENEQKDFVLFKNSTTPTFVTVSGELGNSPSAFVMNPGRWTISIQIEKNILLDYFVLIPEDFYLANLLNQKVQGPCKINEKSLCRQFSYPNVSSFDVKWGAEHTDVLGPGYRDENHLSQMTTRNPYTIPILGKNQSNLTYNLTVTNPGAYVIVINYLTPVDDLNSYTVNVNGFVGDNQTPSRGKIEFYNCHYTTFCRQIITNDYGGVEIYNILNNTISVQLFGENANVGIHSIVAIPYEEWSYDYIQPRQICIKKDDKCVLSSFTMPSESKKYQFEEYENELEVGINNRIPVIISNVTYINLNLEDPEIQISAKVFEPGYYVFVLQYYQPDFPEFELDVNVVNISDGKLEVGHCPSLSGCRAVVVKPDGNSLFFINDNFTTTIKISKEKNIYLDYLMVIPSDLFNIHVLEEQDLDRTGEFISTCGNNNFYIDTTADGFCKDSVFSITAGYNNGALPCLCDYEGSLSFECDKFGGQCPCKPNIIGRQCEACKTGYYGFPDCKPCNCPSTAYCDPQDGQCICPKFVTGEQCDQCMPNTYGYHPLIGCEECKCNPLGIQYSMQCDLLNGSCNCKPHIISRTCSTCEDGYFAFPYCDQCECNRDGTVQEICDKESAECFCKKNVQGPACTICKDGTFNLKETNEDGCTECFCFGKTSKCESSKLIRTRVFDMSNWNLVVINETLPFNLNVTILNTSLHNVNDYTIGADLTGLSNQLVYFSTPGRYLGKKLTAYGGNLNYNIFYTIGQSGKAVRGADVILEGADTYLSYFNVEQPAATVDFYGELSIIDLNFELPDGTPAKREHVMVVLKDLKRLLIRASYWSDSITTRISNVLLDDAGQYAHYDQNRQINFATSVEKCMCPQGYRGLSCEECAPGFYRISSGPYGGFCLPCDCNGHATECDVNTGKCLNCLHNTRGDHCEMCAIGYHGNALQGSPGDCLICACPLPIASNNFATGCDVNAEGDKISCECIDGYMGGRCQACGPGLYGKPEVLGDYCKPCVCSGNIDPYNPGSCDTVTGECLQCLNNTSGDVCQYCKPGFYGDAIRLKNCEACVCDEYGTERCNHQTGECICKQNVIGEKCESCQSQHYGFQSGQGCRLCQCGSASYSSECDDATGQCRCKPGVTGRTCDRCAPGYWNYTAEGCISCECKSEYSSGFSCDVYTGQCKCLKNVSGEKCEHCPYRWVFIEDYGCEPCDNCVHSLLDTTDHLQSLIDPNIKEYGSADSGYFTNRRLLHINDTIKRLNPRIDNLDPDKINLLPVFQELESLEQDSKNMYRKSNYSLDNSKTLITTSNNLRDETMKTVMDIVEAEENVRITIDGIEELTIEVVEGEGPKIDLAVQEAIRLLDEIKQYNITGNGLDANNNLIKTQELLNSVNEYKEPIDEILEEVEEIKDDNVILNEKLDDLLNNTNFSLDKAKEADNLYDRNGKDRVEKLLSNLKNHTYDAEKNYNETIVDLRNASKSLSDTRDLLTQLNLAPPQLEAFILELNETFNKREEDLTDIQEFKPKIKGHATNLSAKASELHGLLRETKDKSETPIKAASAYKDIVKAIKDAQVAAESSRDFVQNATVTFNKLQENSNDAENNSSNLLDDAFLASLNVSDLEPEIKTAIQNSRPIRSLNDENKENLDQIENEMRQLLDLGSYERSLNNAVKFADDAESNTVEAKVNLQHNFKEVTNERNEAKQLPKQLDDANRHLVQIEKQLNHVNEKLPMIIERVKEYPDENERIDAIAKNIDEKISKLIEQIEFARYLANRIKVGVKFQEETTLELHNPSNFQDLSTSTYISGYFRTMKPYGLLFYMGNANGTNLRRTKTDDYLVLEILNGYPVLTLDIGNGPERILNSKYVATNEWYQFIIDRNGMKVKLTIREELPGGKEYETVSEQMLDGQYSIFNLDGNQSKIFLGGYPLEFNMQDNVHTNFFEGEVEDLVIGDKSISLWNFNHGQYNNQGAIERDKLVDLKPGTGYRFNGNGYAVLISRSFNLRSRSDIQLKFKTFASGGLLFLMGKDKTFVSLELRNGKVLYQYNLGSGTKTWHTTKTYNDGLWHTVKASREGANGRFTVDNENVQDLTSPIAGNVIVPPDTIAFGGYPQQHQFIGVTNTDFDGCIAEVYIMGHPVDLSQSEKAYGVTPGCPVKLTRLVSFKPKEGGYINRANVSISNDFKIILKFKTKEKDGLIFYATDRQQTAGISLSLVNGHLKLISEKIELVSKENSFNDSDWHVVSVQHNSRVLRLDFDDYGFRVTDSPPPTLHLLYGNMYIGGLPQNYQVKKGTLGTTKSFSGCIGDVTFKGAVIDFANATDKRNEILGKCILDISVGSDSDIHKVPELPPLVDLEEVTERTDFEVTIDPYEAEIPKRGDGGDDRGGSIETNTELDLTEIDEDFLHPTTLKPAHVPFYRPTSAPPPTPFASCALPLVPRKDDHVTLNSYQFGAGGNSRLEYLTARGKFRKRFDFSFEFKTNVEEGILFYTSEITHQQFVGLFLKNGHVVFVFDGGHGLLRLRSSLMYNDNNWHSVVFSRDGPDGKLVIDDTLMDSGKTPGHTVRIELYPPFYLGGINLDYKDLIYKNMNTTQQFIGCIRNFSMNGKPMENPNEYDVMPCSENVEPGVFFAADGGFVKLEDRYNVGIEMHIDMEIKPRKPSGLLLSAHGKQHYLILEMVNGELRFTMFNGKAPITTSFVPKTPYDLCNGEWHHIQAVKSKSVVSLAVDKISSEPGVGDIHKPHTNTAGSLFLGGHRIIKKIRGLKTRESFVGCIRNVNIKDRHYTITKEMVDGAVSIGSCPTN